MQVQCSAVFWPILAQHALRSMYQNASVARWGFCKQAKVSESWCSVQPGELLLLCPLSPLNTLPDTLPILLLNTARHTAQSAFTAQNPALVCVHCPKCCIAHQCVSEFVSCPSAHTIHTIHIPITQVLPRV